MWHTSMVIVQTTMAITLTVDLSTDIHGFLVDSDDIFVPVLGLVEEAQVRHGQCPDGV